MKSAVDRKMVFVHDSLKQTMLGWHNFGSSTIRTTAEEYLGRWLIPKRRLVRAAWCGGLLERPGVDG